MQIRFNTHTDPGEMSKLADEGEWSDEEREEEWCDEVVRSVPVAGVSASPFLEQRRHVGTDDDQIPQATSDTLSHCPDIHTHLKHVCM